MKKALAILLALSMVFAAFADEPATNYSVAEFKGEASLEYVYDLDGEKSGFQNSDKATLKLNLLNGGNKATSGDGIWGELEIKIDTPDALENPGALSIGKTASVEKAKIHFVDGDYGVALNLKAPSLALGNAAIPGATGDASIAGDDAKKTILGSYGDFKTTDNNVAGKAPKSGAYIAAKKAYDDAVDALAALKKANVYTPEQLLAAERLVTTTKKTLDETAAPVELKTGFALEFTSDIIDANLKVLDNGVAAEKEYGFAADATIKAVENLNVRGAFATAFETTALRFGADYNYKIDDTMYVKPAVDYTKMEEDEVLVAGALFGWGDVDQEPGFISSLGLKNGDDRLAYVSNKCNEGVSVAYKTDLDEADAILVGIYDDSSLLEGLKVGANIEVALEDDPLTFVTAAAKYSTDIDIVTIGLDGGIFCMFGKMVDDLDLDKVVDYTYKVSVSTDDVIDNTDLYANYEAGKENKGTITVGAKIHF